MVDMTTNPITIPRMRIRVEEFDEDEDEEGSFAVLLSYIPPLESLAT